MYLRRSKASLALPIPRKGNKYVARAASHSNFGVPVVIALRDILNLANSAKEVQYMINKKSLKINGKLVKSIKESIRLFGILEADKKYYLNLLPTGRFSLEETSEKTRLCKITGKRIVKKGVFQLNLHDGSNIITKEATTVGDSVTINIEDGKMKDVRKLDKKSKVFVMSGRSKGLEGTVKEILNGKAVIDLDGKEVVLDKSHIIAL